MNLLRIPEWMALITAVAAFSLATVFPLHHKWIFREPNWSAYNLPPDIVTGPWTIGYTDPPVVRPGDRVSLTVGRTELSTINASLRCVDFSINEIPLQLDDGSTLAWKAMDAEPIDLNPSYWGERIRFVSEQSLPIKIAFRLPTDDRIYGREARVAVDMELLYPTRASPERQPESSQSFYNKSDKLTGEFAVKIATLSEAISYERWKSDSEQWEGNQSARSAMNDIVTTTGGMALFVIISLSVKIYVRARRGRLKRGLEDGKEG